MAQVCDLRSKAFSEFVLFIAGDEIRWEEREAIKAREKKVAASKIVDGLFTIPETVSVVKIVSPYKVVDDTAGKSIHLADSKPSSGTTCIYPLKKR
ncbi:MAG: hypothetical protein EXQ86_11865 [Rhodospirillales bacterium]|nr:hypothetical protein [Rhodospirillales bacterium]